MKRRQNTLHYCDRCKATTRHTETETTTTCIGCGAVKTLSRVVKAATGHQPTDSDSHW